MQPKLPILRVYAKRFPLLTILASLFAVIASFSVIFSARFNTDVTRLIPENAEKTSLYFSLIEKTGGMDKAYIVFSSDRIMDHTGEIEEIAKKILQSRMVKTATWKITAETKAFLKDVYARKAPLLLSEKEMEEFVRKLSPEGMAKEIEKTRQRLALPGDQEGLAALDPLNLSEVFLSHMRLSDVSFDPESGYFLTPDRKKLIMVLTPSGSPRDIGYSQKFVNRIEAILDGHRTGDLSAEITGNHAITLHEASAMKREIIWNTVSSLASVMLVFFIFFRSAKGLLYVMLPVVIAMVTTTALMQLFSGSLSEVTGAFAGMLAGLSDDLGIVLYVRYLVTMDDNANPIERMDRTISGVYRGITTGMLTTALTFLPMGLSSFRGIREMGIMTGTGMLLCWLFLFTVTSLAIKPSSGRFITIPALRDIAVFSYRRPYAILAVTLCSMLAVSLFIPRIQFMGDLTKLGTDDNRPREVLDSLKDTYIKEQGVFITDITMDMESALLRSVEIKEALARDFDNVSAAGDILPPVVRQKKNLAILASLDPDLIERNFRRIASEKGFDMADLTVFSGGLRSMLRNRAMINVSDVEPVHEVLDRLLVNEDDQWRIVVTGNLKQGAPQAALAGLAHTGPSFIRHELFSILKKDTLLIGIAGLLLVSIILYCDFRNVYHVLLCQAPVFVSIISTLGIMGAAGISLNFMDAIVFVLLFGIGTDYTVHLLHSYLQDRDIEATFLRTGKAVLVAGLTTIAGFGSIGFSTYRGLATMGQVSSIGTALCVLLSLTLIPALIALGAGQRPDGK